MPTPVVTKKDSAFAHAPHANAIRLVYDNGTLCALDSQGNAVPLTESPVWAFNGRTGAVMPVAGDYAASEVNNDSSVGGGNVKLALETLDSGKAASNHNHDAVYAAFSHTHAGEAITSGSIAAARIPVAAVTQHASSILHQSLNGAGTNTHAQIDTHIANAALHTPLDDLHAADAGYLWSSLKSSNTFLLQTTRGAANGVAPLDGTSKVPVAYLPAAVLGSLNYQGTWDASDNDPELDDLTGEKGWYYRVVVAGTQDLGSGAIAFSSGDWVLHNGFLWEKADNTDAVTSVAGRTGAVVIGIADVTSLQATLDDRPKASGSQSFNDAQKIQLLENIGIHYNATTGELEVPTVDGLRRIIPFS